MSDFSTQRLVTFPRGQRMADSFYERFRDCVSDAEKGDETLGSLASAMGLSRDQLYRIRYENAKVDPDKLPLYAQVLGTTVGWLLEGLDTYAKDGL